MIRRDPFTGLFWLVISLLICLEAIHEGTGDYHNPGPGFLPFWSGAALGTLAIILIVKSLLKTTAEEGGSLWRGLKWNKVVLCAVCLIVYAILLPKLGYLISTFGLMIILFGIIIRPKLWVQLVSAFVTVLITYFIFYLWLEVQLPRGLLGF
jgi:putative tricarboxylic transport membrane protein